MSITLALFLLCIAGWLVLRLMWPITELHRRIFWISIVALAVLPSFTPAAQLPAVKDVLWPILAGLGSGEALFGTLKKKFPGLGAAKTVAPANNKPHKKRKKKP